MPPLKNIEIKDYRAIERVSFAPLRINILVGPNNSGKSSILEAIALNVTCRDRFKDAVGNNIWRGLIEDRRYDYNFLIHEGAQSVEVTCNEYRLNLEVVKSGVPEGERGRAVTDYLTKRINDYINFRNASGELFKEFQSYYNYRNRAPGYQTTLFDAASVDEQDAAVSDIILDSFERYLDVIRDDINYQLTKCEKIIYTGYVGQKLDFIYVYFNAKSGYQRDKPINRRFLFDLERTGIITIKAPSEWPEQSAIVDIRRTPFPEDINDYHDRVVKQNKILETIEDLKKRIHYVQDIRKTDEGIHVLVAGHKKSLPLSSMGDGFISLLKLSFMNTLIQDGVVILEEPEVSLHPGFIEVMVDGILKNSKNAQFFISTHSKDFINSMLDSADLNGSLDDILILRLHKRLDLSVPEIEPLSGREALDEVETISLDLRGV